jgi:GntR family transcriptional regulator, transcriptional repressor for pyruvate dehydrogenase complex
MSTLSSLSESEGAPPSPVTTRARRVSFGHSNLAERTSVIDDIVVEIRAKIVSGEFRDGDTLPSQDEMARALGVSRASLREALNRLVLMGLVEIRHGRGTFVRTARPQDLMNSLSSLLILDKPSAAELLQARFHVESALSALAALNATDEDVERMRLLIERMERESSTLNVETFVPWDAQIHMAFAQAANNPVLVKVLEIIWDVLPQRIRHITSVEQIPSFIAFHRAIYEAIARRDPVEARKQMERHVEHLIHLNEHTEPIIAPLS